MKQFRNGELVFDVTDVGPPDGDVVVLLHGFPQFRDSWDLVIPHLTAAGYRCVAPDQRGYSPGARPRRRRDYRAPLLVDDISALIDAAGAERVHLVGHDWGAGAAWAFAAVQPDRLASLAPIAVPHPAAFLRAVATSRQFLSSWYMYAFQLPRLPELQMIGDGSQWQRLSRRLQASGQTQERADRDARRMAQDGTLTGAINWYRAMFLTPPRLLNKPVTVPTMFLWGEQDQFVKAVGAKACGKHVSGPYRFEQFPGASHWLPEEQPEDVARLLAEHFEKYPV